MKNQQKFWNLKTCKLKSPCPKCGNTEGVIYQGKGIHAGVIRCAECDRFLKWISKGEFDQAVNLGLVNGESFQS